MSARAVPERRLMGKPSSLLQLVLFPTTHPNDISFFTFAKNNGLQASDAQSLRFVFLLFFQYFSKQAKSKQRVLSQWTVGAVTHALGMFGSKYICGFRLKSADLKMGTVRSL